MTRCRSAPPPATRPLWTRSNASPVRPFVERSPIRSRGSGAAVGHRRRPFGRGPRVGDFEPPLHPRGAIPGTNRNKCRSWSPNVMLAVATLSRICVLRIWPSEACRGRCHAHQLAVHDRDATVSPWRAHSVGLRMPSISPADSPVATSRLQPVSRSGGFEAELPGRQRRRDCRAAAASALPQECRIVSSHSSGCRSADGSFAAISR